MLGYLLSDDLMFTSRVTSTARAFGLEMQTARSPAQLMNLLAACVPQCLLVDLQNPGLSVVDLMGTLLPPRPYVVGYGTHVDAAALKAARDVGFDLVLPRSKFVEELAKSLPQWFEATKTAN
jgi:CheY-like chemotaxis protein